MISLFRGASLLAQIGTLLALFGGVAVGYIAWKKHIFNSGYNAAIAAIAAQDRKAVDAAKAARINYRACVDTDGMRWDQQTGKCQRGGM